MRLQFRSAVALGELSQPRVMPLGIPFGFNFDQDTLDLSVKLDGFEWSNTFSIGQQEEQVCFEALFVKCSIVLCGASHSVVVVKCSFVLCGASQPVSGSGESVFSATETVGIVLISISGLHGQEIPDCVSSVQTSDSTLDARESWLKHSLNSSSCNPGDSAVLAFDCPFDSPCSTLFF